MGINIDVNMYLLFRMFDISSKKLSDEYSGMTVDQIMAEEAKQGNTKAANFDASILGDPVKLIELFELKDPGNKFAILSNMNQGDLENLLPMLDDKSLIEGLNYFTKDKLLNLVEYLPKDQLLNLTFDMFSPEHLMMLMPDGEINKVLMSSDMQQNKELELKYLKAVNPAIMARMIEAVTGQEAAGVKPAGLDGQPSFDQEALYSQLTNLPSDKFQDALLCMPPVAKREFVLGMSQANPKIFEMFDSFAYVDIIDQKKEKQDIIRSANVLDSEQLVKMNTSLPKELEAAVLTQMATSTFAKVLIANFQSVLKQIVPG